MKRSDCGHVPNLGAVLSVRFEVGGYLGTAPAGVI